jgi:hypothetical protein
MMAIIPNQKVMVKWSPKIKKYYESILDNDGNRKYFWTKQGDEFWVEFEDLLQKSSNVLIQVQCDYCNKIFNKSMFNYVSAMRKTIAKIACSECKYLKIKEINLLKKNIKI